jgi:hypothetical protein
MTMPAAASIANLWARIRALGDAARAVPIADLFAADPKRTRDFTAPHDPSTTSLIARFRGLRGEQ